jgi:hypothetical protein
MSKRTPKRPRWRAVFTSHSRLIGFIEQQDDQTWRAIAGEAMGTFPSEAAAEDFIRAITGGAEIKGDT